MKVLIIDDDPGMRSSLGVILEVKGFDAIPAETGSAALVRVEQQEIDVALIDLKLEDMSGMDVLRGIKELSPDTECILLTGHASQESAIIAVNLGAYSYFQKPFDMDQLILTIRRAGERRVALRALRASEERYRTLAENMHDTVWLMDMNLQLTYISPSLFRRRGFTQEELNTLPLDKLMTPESFERIMVLYGELLTPENLSPSGPDITRFIELENYRKDGSTFWTDTTLTLLRDQDRNPIGIQGSGSDITERKQSEERTRESEARYRGLFEDSPVSLWEEDFSAVKGQLDSLRQQGVKDVRAYFSAHPDFVRGCAALVRVVDVNQATLELFGAACKQDLLQSLTIIFPDETYEVFAEELALIAEGRYKFGWEGINQTLDGRQIEVSTSWSVAPGCEEDLSKVIISLVDITERKKAQEEVQQRLKELEMLYENSLALSHLLESKEIGQAIIKLLSQKLSWHNAVIRLYHADTTSVEVLAVNHAGMDAEELERERQRLQEFTGGLDKGISGWVMQHGSAVRCDNVLADRRYLETYPGIQCGMYVPIQAGGRTLGCIAVESESAEAFSEQDEHILFTLAGQAAVAFDNARLHQQALRHAEQMLTVNEIGRMLSETFDLEQVYGRLSGAIHNLLPDICAIFISLFDESAQTITCSSAHVDGEFMDVKGLPVLPFDPQGKGRQSHVLLSGEAFIANDLVNTLAMTAHTVLVGDDKRKPDSALYVPMTSKGRVIGVMQVQSYTPNRFSQQDADLLALVANTAAITIENARLFQSAQEELQERQRAEAELRTLNQELEQRVQIRTAELQASNAELGRAMRLKDEFLASMSHELRTPLANILNLSESLQEQVYGELNERQLKSLGFIEESGRHLLGLINDILDFSKIEAGQIKLEVENFLINDVCRSSLQIVKGLAQRKNQSVAFTIQPESFELYADARRLKQILVNLLSNAVKFTPEGGKLGLDVEGDSAMQCVRLTVWDTGIGIALEDFPRLFQPFIQLDSRLSRQQAGTGLGLALVQRMVDLHGGSISLESTPGGGSRFCVSLPWLLEDEAASEEDSGEVTADYIPHAAEHACPRILLVDDNETNLTVCSDYLLGRGFRLEKANGGEEGVRLAREFKPDVIIMDIQMPGMDGLEAIRRIRGYGQEWLTSTIILALTALAMPGDRLRCLEAGADEYLSKPVSLKRLELVIWELLAQFGKDKV